LFSHKIVYSALAPHFYACYNFHGNRCGYCKAWIAVRAGGPNTIPKNEQVNI
jgi:hypothetical protein